MFWRKRRDDDTQPLPTLTPNTIDALKVLNEARARRQEAKMLNDIITDKASTLNKKRNENHFYQSFVSILRTE